MTVKTYMVLPFDTLNPNYQTTVLAEEIKASSKHQAARLAMGLFRMHPGNAVKVWQKEKYDKFVVIVKPRMNAWSHVYFPN